MRAVACNAGKTKTHEEDSKISLVYIIIYVFILVFGATSPDMMHSVTQLIIVAYRAVHPHDQFIIVWEQLQLTMSIAVRAIDWAKAIITLVDSNYPSTSSPHNKLSHQSVSPPSSPPAFSQWGYGGHFSFACLFFQTSPSS